MNIDNNILDKIRGYYSEELSEAEAKEVERLIRSDEQYVLHNKLFRAARRGIKQAIDGPKKNWMQELDQAGLSDEEKTALERLKKNDRSGTSLRRTAFAVIILIFIAFAGYKGWQKWGGEDATLPEQTSHPKIPIAQESTSTPEEEELVGSTGATIPREAEVLVFSPEANTFEPTGKKRDVLMRQWPEPGLSYVFTGDTLIVFAENPETFKDASLRWLEKDNAVFLGLDGKIYELDKGASGRQLLKEATGWEE
ncbi:MAG: hypothetical protein KDD19_23270 [Phaeodactylibacter sp.]|nr:hypothetical protein [Phaeodactylibacter sp.]MCB9049490.1 hypothetical protein [Lewinellaceae bacterium]